MLYPVAVAFMPEKEIARYDFSVWFYSPQGEPVQQRSPYRVQQSTESAISVQNSSDQLAWPQWKWQAQQIQKGCDHTSTNAPDSIRTPKLNVLEREQYQDERPSGKSSCCTTLSVTTTLRDSLDSDVFIPNCPVLIKDREILTDLVLLDFLHTIETRTRTAHTEYQQDQRQQSKYHKSDKHKVALC